jgi:uncharacterized protein YbaR (Trm112 family)
MSEALDEEFLKRLACPVDGGALIQEGDELVSAAGRRYPVIEGVPVLLPPDGGGRHAGVCEGES